MKRTQLSQMVLKASRIGSLFTAKKIIKKYKTKFTTSLNKLNYDRNFSRLCKLGNADRKNMGVYLTKTPTITTTVRMLLNTEHQRCFAKFK